MSIQEIIAAAVIVVLLLGIVGYFSRQELHNLRRARSATLSDDDRRRLRFRAWRRLASCVLLLVLAGLLAGTYFIDRSRERIMEPGDDGAAMNAEQQAFWQVYSYYWIAILMVLFAVIVIVGYDLWSLRRWGLREQRRLQQDHREMLEHEVSLYLRQRNGHKG
jgi:uncharacterized membrane protein YjgN (DUF898 family)